MSLAPVAAVSTHNVEHVCTERSVARQRFVEMYFMIVLRILLPGFAAPQVTPGLSTVSPAAVVTAATQHRHDDDDSMTPADHKFAQIPGR